MSLKKLMFNRYAYIFIIYLGSIFFVKLKAQTCQTYNTNGNYTVPAGVTTMTVYCWGGGGGGGGAAGTGTYGASGGGGGGGACSVNIITVSGGQVYSYTIGVGGVAGTSTTNGGTGGTTIFTGPAGTYSASGGIGGNSTNIDHTTGTGGAGGSGGTGTVYSGGLGGGGFKGSASYWASGGGGGGGAGSGGVGSAGSTATGAGGGGASGGGGTGTYAGGSGSTGVTAFGNGTTASAPGGGGGGGSSESGAYSGGTGGGGQIVVCYFIPCSGTPSGGTAAASVTSGCSGYSSTISLSGGATGSGLSYQWYSSPDNSTWTIISGATSNTYNATVNANTYYQCVTTCSASGLSGTSSSVLCSATAPVNDACSAAISAGVVSSTYSVTGDNTCGTTSTGGVTDPTCAGYVGMNNTVWYTFTTPSTAGNATVSVTKGTMTYASVGVYSGSCGSFSSLACKNASTSGATSSVTLSCLSANTTYYIMVYDNAGTAGTFTLNINYASPSCSGGAAAASLTSGCSGYSTNLSLSGVTGCGFSYQWQSSPNNSTWTNIGGATSSTYTATVSSNTYYQCVVTCSSGGSSNSSSVLCSVTGGSVPSNDLCSGAIALNSGVTLTADNTCATSTGDPTGMCSIDGSANENSGSLWYTYTPSVNGTIILTATSGTLTWPMINMYSGSCASLAGHSCAIYSAFDAGIISITQCLTAGTTYYFLVSNDNHYGVSGTFSLTTNYLTNDACSNAISAGVITSAGYNTQGDNSCASKNTGGVTDPSPSCANTYSNNTVWYSFTTPSYSSNYTITAVPSGGSFGATYLGLGVFSGSCGSFTQQGCSFPGTSAGIPAVVLSCLPANTTYYVMVYSDTHNGYSGGFYFNITSPSCSAGNAVATTITKCSAGSYTTSLSLPSTTGCITNYQWQSSTDNLSWSNIVGATSAAYTATVSANTYYQCVITCSDGSTSTSSSVYCSVANAAPVNDVPGGAINLTFQGGINLGDYISKIEGDNSCATADGTSSCFTANKSVWYSFTAPVAGNYNVMLESSSSTMILPELSIKLTNTVTETNCAGINSGSVYSSGGTSTYGYSPFSAITGYYSEASACNVAAGQKVYIMVDNYNGTIGGYTGAAGTFTLTVGLLNNDQIPSGVVVNNCGSVFNSSTIGATNCGNGIGSGYYGNLDNNTTSNSYGSGDDVGYTVENDSWYQFCTVSEATVTVNFQPITSSCLPSAANGGSGALQISIYTGTSSYLSSHVAGGTSGMQVTSPKVYTYAMLANQCSYIEVDGYAGTNCNYQLAVTMTPGCVLPVEILSFSGILQEDLRVKLNWVTASESNSDYYLIERSTDGINYFAIGTIKAAGNSESQITYEMYDNNPAKGRNYYKLTEFDKNGTNNFLGYATVSNQASLPLFGLYPNPAQNNIILSLKNFSVPNVSYELYDGQGLLIKTETVNLIDGDNNHKIDLSQLNKGIYYVKVNTGEEVLKKTFVKID